MNLIVAADKNRGIGYKGKLLYNIPDDLKYFKEKTLGKAVVMGYNTLLSLPKSAPLRDRANIVLVKDRIKIDGAAVVTSLEELFEKLKKFNGNDVFVIGGQSVYTQLAPHCEYAYITEIDAQAQADAFLEIGGGWETVEKSEERVHNNIKYKFCKYRNLNMKSI